MDTHINNLCFDKCDKCICTMLELIFMNIQATDWWSHSPSCPQCIGLPVEREIVLEALRQDILPVALSSSNRAHKCWTGRDIPVASRLITHIYTHYLHSDYSIPLYLLGASSGGSFVGMLAQSKSTKPKVSAICVQIMALNNYSSLPPSLFVLMTRDATTLHHVERNAPHLKDCTVLRVEEKAITPTFFYDHGQALSKEDSAAVHAALKTAGKKLHLSIYLSIYLSPCLPSYCSHHSILCLLKIYFH